MLAGVRAFLEGIIDYAGLFPPAELPLDQAVANYLRYRQEPDSWMLGRFICPAARLKELSMFKKEVACSGPVRLSVLGRGGRDLSQFMANLKLDMDDVADLDHHLGVTEGFEVRMPVVLGEIMSFMHEIRPLLDNLKLTPFFECPHVAYEAIDRFAEALQRVDQREAGWKLRCTAGVPQATAYPTPQDVAGVLIRCYQAHIPFKATAGLHHPIRHTFPADGPMHGFLNVFGAGILLHARQVDATDLETLLADEDASHFNFDETGFAWKNHHATTDAIRLARRDFVTSFGSCSFDEPCDDLRRLGWI